jgi:hypothetical protein
VKPTVESVFCDDCGEIRPVSYDFLPGGAMSDHDATDILCDRNHVVAVLHHPKHTISEKNIVLPKPYIVGPS